MPTDLRAPLQLRFSGFCNRSRLWGLVLFSSDGLALALSWKLAATLNRPYLPLPPQLVWWDWLGLPSLFWVFTAMTLVVLAWHGFYSLPAQGKSYVRTGQLVSLMYLLALVLQYFYDPKLDPPRSLFFTAWVSSVVLIVGMRLLTTLLLRQLMGTAVKVFLIAPAERLTRLAKTLKRHPHYQVVGAALATTVNTPATLEAILAAGTEEVLAEQLPEMELASSFYWQLRRFDITLRLVPTSLDTLYRRGLSEIFAGVPTLRITAPFFNGWDYRLKRLIDFLGALVALLLLSPLLIGVAIAIKLSSPGAVFFCQERVGLHGKVFQMWKFRTMIPNASEWQTTLEKRNQTQDGIMFKIKDDPRIIPVGHFLRRTSIDELPQLFNVLLGQMSLVGPRPLPLRDVERFAPWHHIRHQVLPGITGLWQISGRSQIADFNEAARLDLYYIDNWSLNLDLEILLETVQIILFGQGAY
ncbi:sugar transferase [Neosynechococcus sphagnicola]|uniref:sugar transferase n=1 Tax=Neosynechococcus sphagnicola TaxID=1501145 RepID=UPI001EF9FEFD|nr:sugar transferase [Neosynechococcus sphagnicola]